MSICSTCIASYWKTTAWVRGRWPGTSLLDSPPATPFKRYVSPPAHLNQLIMELNIAWLVCSDCLVLEYCRTNIWQCWRSLKERSGHRSFWGSGRFIDNMFAETKPTQSHSLKTDPSQKITEKNTIDFHSCRASIIPLGSRVSGRKQSLTLCLHGDLWRKPALNPLQNASKTPNGMRCNYYFTLTPSSFYDSRILQPLKISKAVGENKIQL